MRIIFMGTPDFAVPALKALAESEHTVTLVVTQPDRPKGRSGQLAESDVKKCAESLGIPVFQPERVKRPEAVERLREEKPDAIVVAAYGQILSQEILDLPRYGCINIHGSLLPRWRGAAPIQRAIEAGDTQTGISIMKMEKGLDTGPVLLVKSVPITSTDTAATLTEKLTELGAQAIVQALENAESLKAVPQDDTKATYAQKLLKTESDIDWNTSVTTLNRRCRAFFPFPGLKTTARGESVKIWALRPTEGNGIPGQVLCAKKRLVVACADGAVECLRLQKAGKPVMDVAAFLQSFSLQEGDVLK